MTSEPSTQTERDRRRDERGDRAAARARAKASRPWYRKKRFLIPLALVALFVIIGVASDDTVDPTEETGADAGDDAQAADEPAEPEEEAEPESARIGDPAADGAFTFTVNEIECDVDEVGGEFTREEPQGQFCLLSVRVENTGDQAGSLFADNQFLLESDGTQHSASSMATIVNDPEGDAFFAEINPGNAVEGEIVFDVPKKAEIAAAQLHDSALSGGVRVEVAE